MVSAAQRFANELKRVSRGADFLVESLVRAGADVLFTLPADSINPLVDACRRNGRIRLVTTRHEGSAALMASAYAKLTGRLGACAGTNGPGVTHLPIGVSDAQADRVPLVALCGAVTSDTYGTDAFQEVDSAQLLGAVADRTHSVWTVGNLGNVPARLRQAVNQSQTLALALAPDVLLADAEAIQNRLASTVHLPSGWHSGDELVLAAQQMIAGRKVVVALSDLRDSPELATCIPAHVADLTVGVPESIATPARDIATPARDIAVPAWDSVPVPRRMTPARLASTLGPGTALIVVGTWPARTMRDIPHEVPVLHITAQPSGRLNDGSYVNIVGSTGSRVLEPVERSSIVDALDTGSDDPHLRDRTVKYLERIVADDATVAVEPGLADALYLDLSARSRRFTSSFGAATPGYAIPAAIAAKVAHPARAAVALTDDKGLYLSLPELLTARKYDLPLEVIVLTADIARPDRDLDRLARSVGFEIRRVTEGSLPDQLPGGPPVITIIEDPIAAAAHEHSATVSSVADEARAVARQTGRRVVIPLASPLAAARHSDDSDDVVCEMATAEGSAMFASAVGKIQHRAGCLVLPTDSDVLYSLNGLYDAAYDHAPLAVVTLDEGSTLDSTALLGDLAVSTTVTGMDRLRTAIGDAVVAADSVHGVVHVRVTHAPVARDHSVRQIRHQRAGRSDVAVLPDPAAVQQAARVLSRARRPLLIAGAGALAAPDAVASLATGRGWPIAATMGAAGAFDSHPLFTGYVGSSGHPMAMSAVRRSDAILVLGVSNRGAVYALWGQDQAVIAVNADERGPQAASRNTTIVVSSVPAFMQALHLRLPAAAGARAAEPAPGATRYRRWRAHAGQRVELRGELRPSYVISTLAQLATGESPVTFTADVGLNTLWLLRYGPPHSRTVWTRNFATMGFALPAAIASGWLNPDGVAVAVVGDGGFVMTMTEIQTAVRLGVPVVVVVLDNGRLGAIRYEQEIMGWPEHESSLWNGDFAQFAKALGADGVAVSDAHGLTDALDQAVRTRRPTVVHVTCSPDEPPMPAGRPQIWARASIIMSWVRQGRRGVHSARTTIPGSWQS
ncbi:MAG TPA: thiamine pyrophosphate-dependent enzyme [Micromonosporaceae bacterium]|nr:thiamine pyrophosphate-dependent enzyme [Micromonosporaceae bacterium]